MDDIDECVEELRLWAGSRIEWCRKEEQKFGASNLAIQAATERRALMTVLEILGPRRRRRTPTQGDKP